jgi:hypothetical protein
MTPGQHVLERRQIPDGGPPLKRPDDPLLGDLVRLHARDVVAGEKDLAGFQRDEPCGRVEEGRLAGPVGPDDPPDLALGHLGADVLKRREAAELHREMVDREERLGVTRL